MCLSVGANDTPVDSSLRYFPLASILVPSVSSMNLCVDFVVELVGFPSSCHTVGSGPRAEGLAKCFSV